MLWSASRASMIRRARVQPDEGGTAVAPHAGLDGVRRLLRGEAEEERALAVPFGVADAQGLVEREGDDRAVLLGRLETDAAEPALLDDIDLGRRVGLVGKRLHRPEIDDEPE